VQVLQAVGAWLPAMPVAAAATLSGADVGFSASHCLGFSGGCARHARGVEGSLSLGCRPATFMVQVLQEVAAWLPAMPVAAAAALSV
jgi:hypothetical protein